MLFLVLVPIWSQYKHFFNFGTSPAYRNQDWFRKCTHPITSRTRAEQIVSQISTSPSFFIYFSTKTFVYLFHFRFFIYCSVLYPQNIKILLGTTYHPIEIILQYGVATIHIYIYASAFISLLNQLIIRRISLNKNSVHKNHYLINLLLDFWKTCHQSKYAVLWFTFY